MGKSKKTRWRTLSLDGLKDESDGTEAKVNGTEPSKASQKYSQILGDHHTNSSNHLSNKTSSHHSFKSRNFNNNKENYYSNRTTSKFGGSQHQKSWQRGGYRTPLVNGKDKRPDVNGKATANETKSDSTAEPIKFNEDEYTRITTPRQDVLFKKGYLSRMNNKTALPSTNTSATVNSAESTAASSLTNSDPDSSVSTLSPATTPSMDYGNMDSMEFAPMYYPGYYDENGMLMIPAMYNCNNYNYGSATSPVFLMPYPSYQYDPFFMAPSSEIPADGEQKDATTEEKTTEADATKENNQSAEDQKSGPTSSSSEDGANSNHGEGEGEEIKGDQSNGPSDNASNVSGQSAEVREKTNITVYPSEPNGFVFPPTFPNGYYNNFYYYNGPASSRPPKMRRRKRFINPRNSHSHQQHYSAADTTTDYSDDDNNITHKRFYSRYHNGWTHHNGHNQYHNGRFHRRHMEQNFHQQTAPQASNLNVDVQEFIPRVQPITEPTEIESDATNVTDLQQKTSSPKPKAVEAPKPVKTSASHPSKPSKREIIEGIKSMEEQNINLAATKVHQTLPINNDVEWNVIKKGKKVKVVKDPKTITNVQEIKKVPVEEVQVEEPAVEQTPIAPEPLKKLPAASAVKAKKSKNKNKKKKSSHMSTKLDGFEIIEPEFGAPTMDTLIQDDADETQDVSEEEQVELLEIVETVNETPSAMVNNEPECVNVMQDIQNVAQEPIVEQIKVPELIMTQMITPQKIAQIEIASVQISLLPEVVSETLIKPEVVEPLKQEINEVIPEQIVKMPEVIDLSSAAPRVEDDDAIIDISDEDICCKVTIPLEIVEAFESKDLEVSKSVIEPATVKLEKTLKIDIKKAKVEQVIEPVTSPFQDDDYFKDRANIAALERDLMENLKLLDDEIELKSPIINPLHDFPITSAVRKWLQEKNNESFDTLFHIQNLKKLREIHDESDDDCGSDISDGALKSDTDSDYASDVQLRSNGNCGGSCSTHAKADSKSAKCNKLIAKESFCALM